jgi:hypothetical protein
MGIAPAPQTSSFPQLLIFKVIEDYKPRSRQPVLQIKSPHNLNNASRETIVSIPSVNLHLYSSADHYTSSKGFMETLTSDSEGGDPAEGGGGHGGHGGDSGSGGDGGG